MTDLLSSSQFWLLISIGFYALGVEIQKKTGFAIKELNLGGGFGIKYRSKDRPEAYGAIWAVWRALSRSTPHFAALKRLIFSLSRAAPLSARRGLRSTQSRGETHPKYPHLCFH